MLRCAVAVVAALAVSASACTSEAGQSAPEPSGPAAPPTTEVPSLAAFSLGPARVSAPDPAIGSLPPEVVAGVQATLDRYLADAVVAPLGSGRPAADLAPLFTPNARARLDGPDRAALVDEGLPAAGDVRVHTASAALTALAGADGQVGVVLARIELQVTSRVGSTPVAIHRHGELTLVPHSDAWRIDSYQLTVTRDTPPTTGPATGPASTAGGRP